MVCRSVCLSVTLVSPAITAEPIEMPFGLWAWMGRWNRVLDGAERRDVAMATYFVTQFVITGFVGYNFGCMIASDALFDSMGGFSGKSYPMLSTYGVHIWRHLANTTELSMCGGDAALCQITLTTCWSLLWPNCTQYCRLRPVTWEYTGLTLVLVDVALSFGVERCIRQMARAAVSSAWVASAPRRPSISTARRPNATAGSTRRRRSISSLSFRYDSAVST